MKKKCCKCNQEKEVCDFPKHKKMKSGHDTICKECSKKRAKEYYKNNKEKKKEYQNFYYKNNKEKRLEYSAKYREKNKEKINIYFEEYAKTDYRKIYKANKSSKRRSWIQQETDITEDFLIDLKRNYKICSICNNEMNDVLNDKHQYNLDHIIPLNIGGKHIKKNVRFICKFCNERRPKSGSDVIPKELNYSYSNEEQEREFFSYYNSVGNYSSVNFTNRIVLTHQPFFFKKEKELWKDPKIKIELINNRIKYLDKGILDITEKELLRGFKISGINYSFSHFSPLWIKAFIEEFDIKSIYDPTGGWGHRLIGAWKIDYIYNDVNTNIYNGVKNIFDTFKKYNKKNKQFFNEDSSKIIPNLEYDAVFTCPPYFIKEDYGVYIEKDYYKWLNEWWRLTVKNSLINCKKYFAFVINEELKNDMINICLNENLLLLKEQIIGKKKSHFTVGKNEILVIMKKASH